jgi:hypothetical protein
MKKKLFVLCMVVCLLVTISVPAYAALPEPGIEPMAEYHFSSKASLTISSSGVAEATGKIVGLTGVTTKTTVHLYLQRYENGEWVDIDDWISSNNTVNTTLVKTKTVAKGYTYRAKASCYAYSGSAYENVVRYSSEIKY